MASDGKIVIDVILEDGRVVKGVADINKQIDGIDKSAKSASSGVKDMVTSLGLVAAAQKGIQLVTSALDGAIKRFDVINGFPSVMERMGFSSESAQKSINKLSEGIQGLPTTLDGIVGSAQNIAVLTGDLDTATDTALSLNNAFLASGASASDAERGLVQYVQMLSKGSVDMQSWRTLQETMGFALNKTAEAFGFAGESAQNELYAALKDGDIPFKEFNAKIIELNGGVNGFADIAKNSSAGIGTSFTNLRNAIVVGVANMIFAFDKLTKEVTGKTIAENLDSLKVIIRTAFATINDAIGTAAPIVKVFAAAISAAIPVVNFLTPAIIGLTAAFAAYTVITKASAAIDAAKIAIAAAEATTKALTIATNARVASQIIMTTTDRAGTAVTVASTSAITLKTAVIGVLTGAIKLSTVAQIAATAATTAWGAAIKFLMGPVGWVTAGIGLLVTGVIGLVSWINKSTEEGERLTQQNEALAESTKALNTSIDESSTAYEKNQKSIETNAQAYTELVAQIEELAAKEHKTGEEKKLLNSYIEELNKNVDGLNLVYGEQSDALSATSEQILNRINLMKEEESLQASQERLTEIMKEQIEIGKQQEEITALREEWNQKLEDGSVKSKEHKEAMKELEEQEISLSEANKIAGEERIKVEQQIIESSKAVADAAEKDVGRQLLLFDELSEAQRDAVKEMKSAWDDYASAATDMFDKLSDKSKVSVAEMQKNLEENQRVITEWSENIAKLAERGIDEGLLNTLREAGPESAGHVKALVSASDTELNKLSESFAKGGEVATKALSTSLGIKNSGLLEAVGHLVTGTEKALSDSIKSAKFDELGVDIAKGQAQGIKDGTPEAEKAATEMAKATEDAARKQSETHSPSKVFVRIGTDLADGLALGIKEGINKVLESVSSLVKEIVKPFDNIATVFEKIGQETMAGMQRGLKAGEKQVLATARSIANNAAQTMRQALDIHSPSRVMQEIGEFTGEGLALGIRSTQAIVDDAMTAVGESLISIAEDNAKEIRSIEQEQTKALEKIETDKAYKINQIYAKAKEKKRKLTQSELDKIKKIEADAASARSKSEQQFAKQIIKVQKNLDKEKLDSIKSYIDDKKSLEQLSVKEEIAIWEQAVKMFEVGTKQRIEAQKAYASALGAVNDQVISTNKNFSDRMQKISDEYTNHEKKLTDDYQKTLEDRIASLINFAGTFDEFDIKVEKSGAELLANLTSQVDGFKKWQTEIEKLAAKAIDDGLIAELEQMGPKALGELLALNSLTDEELTKYSDLYREKSELARTQAEKELSGLKDDTENQITMLREVAKTELSLLQSEWVAEIKAITEGTRTELGSLEQIGRDAVSGLINGMQSMHSELQATAKDIAAKVEEATRQTLKTRSPSRVMMSIGKDVVDGLVIGIQNGENAVKSAAKSLTDWLIPKVSESEMKSALNVLNAYQEKIISITDKAEKKKLEIADKYGSELLILEAKRALALAEYSKVVNEEPYRVYLHNEAYEKYKEADELLRNTIALRDEDNANLEIMLKEKFELEKQYMEQRKSLNSITLADEIIAYKQLAQQYKAGSEERVYYDNKIKESIDSIVKKESELTQAYENAVSSRANSLVSFAGLFDEITIASDVSGQKLLENLASQVVAMEDWSASIADLASKGINEGLLAELQAMGPKAIAEIQALNTLTAEELDAYQELWQQKSELARQQAEAELIGMKKDTEQQIADMKVAAELELTEYVDVWHSSMTDVTDTVDDGLSGMSEVGAKAVDLLITGLNSRKSALSDAAKALGETIKAATQTSLDIHSPSRAMIELGEFAGEGLAIGVANKVTEVVSAAKSLAQSIKDTVRENMYKPKEDKTSGSSGGGGGGSSDVGSSVEDMYKEQFDAEKKHIDRLLKYKQLSLTDELKMYEKYLQAYAEGTEQRIYYEDKIADTKQQIHDQLLDLNKDYTEKIKDLNEDFAKEQLDIEDNFAKEKLRIEKDLERDVLEAKELYNERVAKLNEDLKKQEADLIKARENSLINFVGIFDKVEKKQGITGARLMNNLQGQLNTFKKWQKNLDSLESKGIDKALLAELREMGPDAATEIAALNTLTEGELSEYAALWKEKSSIAKSQVESELNDSNSKTAKQIAELRADTAKQLEAYRLEWEQTTASLRANAAAEMEALNTDTANKLEQLRADTAAQLEQYEAEWMKSIEGIKNGTKDEFNAMVEEMPAIGENIILGMQEGLANMTPGLLAQAKSIADSIKATIQAALDIHSPSRWMRDFVAGNMARGFAIGVDKHESLITRASSRLGEWMKPDTSVVNKLRGVRPDVGLLRTPSMQDIRNFNSSTIDKSNHVQATFNMPNTGNVKNDMQQAWREMSFRLGV